MGEFIVTGIPGSPYLRAALLALEEKGMAWRLNPIGFGENASPEYRRLQPFGKIPAFDHDGMRFYETQAMMRYVDRIGPGPSLTPTDPRVALRMDQLMNMVDDYVRGPVSGQVSFPLAVAPRFGLPVDHQAVQEALPAAQLAVAEFARLLGDGPYLAGDQLSLADLMAIPHFEYLSDFDEGRAMLAPYPALTAWVARMAERPSMAVTSWDALLALTGTAVPAAA